MRELAPLAIFGIDVGHLVGDIVRSLIDLLVPDFTGRWANRLVAWLVALPQVADSSQFPALNAFRRELTAVGYGLLSLTFAGAALQAWAAGLVDGRPHALTALSRAALAAGALGAYPSLIGQLILAVNHLTAAVIRHPAVASGINTAIGGALVLGVVSSGLSLGLAAGALLAAMFFLAAIFVMKIALTAMLCVLLVSGALVLALLPLPQGEGLARLWGAGLLAAVTIPVSWALVFSVVGLVASDALVGHGLGPGLELAVKPFVAVACLYLVYKTPGFLVAQARMLGVRLGGTPGLARGAPGEGRLQRTAHGHAALQRDRFRGLGAAAARAGGAGGERLAAAGRRGTRATAGMARTKAASGAVGLVAAAGGQGRGADLVTAGVVGAGAAASGAARSARAVRAGSRAARDWWRNPGSGWPPPPGTTAEERPAHTRVYVPPRREHRVGAPPGARNRRAELHRLGVAPASRAVGTPPVPPLTNGNGAFRDELSAARARHVTPDRDPTD